MTKFLQPSFSHCTAGNKDYAKGWDAVFAKKDEAPVEEKTITRTRPSDLSDAPRSQDDFESYTGVDRTIEPSKTNLEIWMEETEKAAAKIWKSLGETFSKLYASPKFAAQGLSVVNPTGEIVATCSNEEDAQAFADVCNYQLDLIYDNRSDIRKQVQEFHTTYEIPTAYTPCVPERKLLDKQLRCIFEEAFELLEACGGDRLDVAWLRHDFAIALRDRNHENVDLVELADACGDIDYTVESLRLVAGINGKPIAEEIQRSNMSKLGEDGKPIKRADGKILKGPNFSEPDIEGELRTQGWEG